MLRDARTIERTLARLHEDEGRLIDIVRDLPRLNRRQREMLQEVIVVPTTEFWVSRLSERFGAVYSTVRADLRGLHGMGMLSLTVRGATHVYRPVENLAEVLERASKKVGLRS